MLGSTGSNISYGEAGDVDEDACSRPVPARPTGAETKMVRLCNRIAYENEPRRSAPSEDAIRHLRSVLQYAFVNKHKEGYLPNMVLLVGGDGVKNGVAVPAWLLGGNLKWMQNGLQTESFTTITFTKFSSRVIRLAVELLFTGEAICTGQRDIELALECIKELGVDFKEDSFTRHEVSCHLKEEIPDFDDECDNCPVPVSEEMDQVDDVYTWIVVDESEECQRNERDRTASYVQTWTAPNPDGFNRNLNVNTIIGVGRRLKKVLRTPPPLETSAGEKDGMTRKRKCDESEELIAPQKLNVVDLTRGEKKEASESQLPEKRYRVADEGQVSIMSKEDVSELILSGRAIVKEGVSPNKSDQINPYKVVVVQPPVQSTAHVDNQFNDQIADTEPDQFSSSQPEPAKVPHQSSLIEPATESHKDTSLMSPGKASYSIAVDNNVPPPPTFTSIGEQSQAFPGLPVAGILTVPTESIIVHPLPQLYGALPTAQLNPITPLTGQHHPTESSDLPTIDNAPTLNAGNELDSFHSLSFDDQSETGDVLEVVTEQEISAQPIDSERIGPHIRPQLMNSCPKVPARSPSPDIINIVNEIEQTLQTFTIPPSSQNKIGITMMIPEAKKSAGKISQPIKKRGRKSKQELSLNPTVNSAIREMIDSRKKAEATASPSVRILRGNKNKVDKGINGIPKHHVSSSPKGAVVIPESKVNRFLTHGNDKNQTSINIVEDGQLPTTSAAMRSDLGLQQRISNSSLLTEPHKRLLQSYFSSYFPETQGGANDNRKFQQNENIVVVGSRKMPVPTDVKVNTYIEELDSDEEIRDQAPPSVTKKRASKRSKKVQPSIIIGLTGRGGKDVVRSGRSTNDQNNNFETTPKPRRSSTRGIRGGRGRKRNSRGK